MSDETVPTIDLEGFRNGDERSRLKVARELDEAYRRMGFITLVGHGVDPRLLSQMDLVTQEFFALPEADKHAIGSRVLEGQFCGYVGFAADSAAHTHEAQDAPPDLRARFRIVKPTSQAVLDKAGPMQFPQALPQFRDVWLEYWDQMERLGATMMRLCAAALGLPEHFFQSYFNEHFSVLMASHSPPLSGRRVLPGQLRCGEHTDNGTLTFVLQGNSPGCLEVKTVGGRWIPIEPQAGAYVVNIGDLLARWTNDRWVSTVHRVATPPTELFESDSRRSIVFFHQPNLDEPIRCLDTCVTTERPAKYGPITLRSHFSSQQRRLATRQAQPVSTVQA
jgi:isopenicillin N synthase-like dioxygenase